MLAASRNESVIGRTLILIVSIITRNGFNQSGAPPGSRLAAQLEGLDLIADNIKAIHMGRPNLSVKIKCLVNLNTLGSSPIKLTIIIMINRLTKMCLIPFM